MKRTVLVIAWMLCLSVFALAEDNHQYVGVQMGYTQPIFRLNTPITQDKTQLTNFKLNGFNIGLTYDVTFVKGFGLNIGVDYAISSKTSEWDTIQSPYLSQNRMECSRGQMHQLQGVAEFQYKIGIAKETWLVLSSGPAIQCALSYKDTKMVKRNGEKATKGAITNHLVENDHLLENFHRLNVLWNVGGGFQYQRYFVRGSYGFGLMNPYQYDNFSHIKNDAGLSVYQDRNTRGRLDQWQISIGIYFWEK